MKDKGLEEFYDSDNGASGKQMTKKSPPRRLKSVDITGIKLIFHIIVYILLL
jgi:hypothetical protein